MNNILLISIKIALIAIVVGSIVSGAIAHAQERIPGSLTEKEKTALLEVAENTKRKLLDEVFILLNKQFDPFLERYKSDPKMIRAIKDVKEKITQTIPSAAEELILDFCYTTKQCLGDAPSDFVAVQAIYTDALHQAYERGKKTADAYHTAAFAYVVKQAGAFTFQDQVKAIDDYRKFIATEEQEINTILPLVDAEMNRKINAARTKAKKDYGTFFTEKKFQAGLLKDKDYQEAQKARQYIVNFIHQLHSDIATTSFSLNNIQLAFSQILQRLEGDNLTAVSFNARITSANKELNEIQTAMAHMIVLLKDRHLKELKEKYKVDFDLVKKITQLEQLDGQLQVERIALQPDAEKIALFRDALASGGDISKQFQPPGLAPSPAPPSTGAPRKQRKPPAPTLPGGVGEGIDRQQKSSKKPRTGTLPSFDDPPPTEPRRSRTGTLPSFDDPSEKPLDRQSDMPEVPRSNVSPPRLKPLH